MVKTTRANPRARFDHRTDAVALKRRTAYVSPDLNFQVWGKVGKAVRFVRGFTGLG